MAAKDRRSDKRFSKVFCSVPSRAREVLATDPFPPQAVPDVRPIDPPETGWVAVERHVARGPTVTVEPPSALRPSAALASVGGWNRTVTAALVALAAGASLLTGYGVLSGQSRLAVLPLVAVVGITLAVVACTRFSWFVLLLLTIRSTTDALKLSASDAGTSAANTVAARGADPSSIIGVMFLVLGLLWLAATFYDRRPIRVSVVTTMLVGFLLAGALSVLGSDHLQASALQLARLMSAVLMFVVLERLITDRAMLKRVLIACFAALIIPLGYTIFGMATGQASSEVKGGFTRLTGTFTQSNDYARFLTILLLLGVAVLPYVSRRVKPYLRGLLVLTGVFLLLTLTLGAIGAAFAGVVLIALIQRRAALVGLLGAAALGAVVVVPGLLGRITDSTASADLGGGPTGNSLSWRLDFWASLLELNKDNPITGIGLNATQYFTSSAKQPHNDYLSAYIETGVLGLLMYVGLIVAMLVVTGRAVLQTQRDTLEWGVSVGAVVCVGVFAVMSVAANVIQNSANFWYVLAITACASAASRFSTRDDGDTRAGAGPDDGKPLGGTPPVQPPERALAQGHERGDAPN